MKEIIETKHAPPAAGAYSQGTTNGELVFTAGQIPTTPDGEVLSDESIEVQTRQCLENIEAVLKAAGLELENALKVTVFLDDMDEWEGMNKIYQTFFDENPPARSAIAVSGISKGVKIEVEAIATR